jgi:hypothetical protein
MVRNLSELEKNRPYLDPADRTEDAERNEGNLCKRCLHTIRGYLFNSLVVVVHDGTAGNNDFDFYNGVNFSVLSERAS